MSVLSEVVVSDVCVIGSGFAGSLLASRLVEQGLSTVVVEAGNRIDTLGAGIVKPPIDLEASVTDWPYFYHGSQGIGGASLNWFGNALRLYPEDFRMSSLYGVGVDSPLSYEELEEYYCQAEEEIGVAGTPHPKFPWRSRDFPMPGHPLSYSDQVYQRLFKQHGGPELLPLPMARNSKVYRGRAPCHGFQRCIGHCPMNAKYRTDLNHLAALEGQPKYQLLAPVMVTGFEVSRATRRIQRARGKRPDGTQVELQARTFILAGNAIQTPRLLLHAQSEVCPNGVANHGGLVGRYLMDHPSLEFNFKRPERLYLNRGPAQTAIAVDYATGAARAEHSAMLVEVNNMGRSPEDYVQEGLSKKLYGEDLKNYVKNQFGTDYSVKALFEVLPHFENRVELSTTKVDDFGMPLPKATFRFGSYENKGFEKFKELGRRLSGNPQLEFSSTASVCHWLGTCKMGTSEKNGVVDTNHRTFEHPNLYIVGGSNLVTSGVCNPTLTISALALRAAPLIGKDLAQNGL